MESNASADSELEHEELLRRFSRIDKAIAREREQRARKRRAYWMLLALAVTIAIAALVIGPTKPAQVARAVAEDPRLREQIAAEPAFAAAVAEAPAVQEQMAAASRVAALRAADSLEFTERLAANPRFAEQAGVAAVSAVETRPELRERLAVAVGENSELAGEVRALSAETSRLHALIGELRGAQGVPDSVNRRLDETAEMQAALASRLERTLDSDAKTSARLDGLAADVAALKARLAPPGAAALDPLASRSYLLKENRDNLLAGLGLTVSIGKRDGAVLDDVRVTDASRVVFPADGEQGVRIAVGETFEFTDHRGERFVAVFTYTHNRIFWLDFVGFDIYRLPE